MTGCAEATCVIESCRDGCSLSCAQTVTCADESGHHLEGKPRYNSISCYKQWLEVLHTLSGGSVQQTSCVLPPQLGSAPDIVADMGEKVQLGEVASAAAEGLRDVGQGDANAAQDQRLQPAPPRDHFPQRRNLRQSSAGSHNMPDLMTRNIIVIQKASLAADLGESRSFCSQDEWCV